LVGVENKAFDEDFYNFRAVIQDLERRIASVIIQAFDDSTTIMGCFKLLDAFDNLLERNVNFPQFPCLASRTHITLVIISCSNLYSQLIPPSFFPLPGHHL